MSTLARLLSSRVRAEVFRLLFGLDERSLHLRETARQAGLAIGTVQQELRRLIDLGLVEARKDGNRRLFTAVRSHPLHPEIRNLVLKTSGLVDVLRPALEREEGIRLAFIFGSLGRGAEQAHATSI